MRAVRELCVTARRRRRVRPGGGGLARGRGWQADFLASTQCVSAERKKGV